MVGIAAPENTNARLVPRAANWGAVYAMTLCSFVLVASEFMPVSLLTPIASDLQVTEGQAGQAISTSGAFGVLTSLFLTKLIGEADRRHVLLGFTALLAVSGALTAFAPNYPVLLIGRAVVGIAIGGFWSMSAAVAMRLVPAASVSKALAIVNGGNALATVLAAPLGSLLGGVIGWRGTFFVVIPLAGAALIWQAISLPKLPPETSRARGRMLALLRQPRVLAGLIAVSLFFAGQFSLFTYLRPFLEQVTHASVAMISAMLLVVGVSGFLGTIAIGRVLDHRLHTTMAVLPALMAVVAMALTIFGDSLGMTAVLLVIWGVAGTSAPVAWWTWVTRAAPDDAEAGGALMVAVVQLAIAFGATAGGVAFDAIGAKPEFLLSGVILAIASIAAFTVRARFPAPQRARA